MESQLGLALAVISVCIASLALGVGVGRLWAAVYPIYRDWRDQRMLQERFSRGPFDRSTIERSTHYYVGPKCSNIDPTQEREPRHALVATRENLFSMVDKFLDHDSSDRHLLLLGDSGTGKTAFVLNYYAHNARRPKTKRQTLSLVPLGDKNADELIAGIPDPDETVVFLDALDEDVRAIADHRLRIRELMDACRKFRRVVVTCRTQFFPRDEEIPVETGIARLGPRKAGEKGFYEFWKLYLSPFDDEDVKRYLRKRYPIWHYWLRRKALGLALKIPLLTVRPMLLAHIPDLIVRRVRIQEAYQLYEAMIDAWLERESTRVDKNALLRFSEQLALDMYLKRGERGMERIPHEQLPMLTKTWGMDLPHWQLAGRSLLNRDAEGNLKFAHRSIMEYLFVKCLLQGDDRCHGIVLTDQMKEFLVEMLSVTTPRVSRFRQLLSDLELVAECVTHQPDHGRLCARESLADAMSKEIGKIVRSEPHVRQSLSRLCNVQAEVDSNSHDREILEYCRKVLPAESYFREIFERQSKDVHVLLNLRRGTLEVGLVLDMLARMLWDMPTADYPILNLARRLGPLGSYNLLLFNCYLNPFWLEAVALDVGRFVLKFAPHAFRLPSSA